MDNTAPTVSRDELAKDIFVGMVTGMYSTNVRPNPVGYEAVAVDAYKLADAYLAAKAKHGGQR